MLVLLNRRPMTDIWEIGLSQSLSTIPVPLLPEEDNTALNLHPAFITVYDIIGYDLLLDYTRPAVPLLKGKAAKWAADLLTD